MENKELFSKFVEYLKKNVKGKNLVWDQKRTKYLKDNANSIKLILSELSYFDYQDPLNTIDQNYILEKYSSNLISNEIKELSDFINEDSLNVLVEKCEIKERVKKILDYYLNFVIEKNFDYLSNN